MVICEGVSSRLEPIIEWGRRTTIEDSRLPVRARFAGPTYIKGVIEFTAMPHTCDTLTVESANPLRATLSAVYCPSRISVAA